MAFAWASLGPLSCQRADPGATASAPELASRALPRLAAPTPAAASPRAPAPDAGDVTPAASPARLPASSAALPASGASAKSPARPVTRVLILGDSLSDESVGGGGYVKLLRERCPGVPFENRARGGFMVNQMRKRLETEVLPEGQRYSHAIVFGGVNDLYSDQTANRSLTRIEADLSRIYTALKAHQIDVVAITVAPWGGFKRWYTAERGQNTLALNRWVVSQTAQGVTSASLDAYPLLSCGNPELLCPELAAPFKDGLHFGKLGQKKLGQALYELAFTGCASR